MPSARLSSLAILAVLAIPTLADLPPSPERAVSAVLDDPARHGRRHAAAQVCCPALH